MLSEFHSIRRQDRTMDTAQALDLLTSAEYGFLSLGQQTENDYAYGVPLNFAYDKATNALYFHCALEGQKLNALKQNPKVSFCVVGSTQPVSHKFTSLYESVIAFGTANINPSIDDKKFALRLLVKKYSPQHIEQGEVFMENMLHRTQTFKIQVEHTSAKCNR